MYFRIVRINEDGSVRLIYQGESVDAEGTETTIGSSMFNSHSAEVVDNAYLGYMYGTIGATGDNAYELTHTNSTSSTVKDAIDLWYLTYLAGYSDIFSTEAGFCNDRSVAPSAGLWNTEDTALGYGKNETQYGAYNRLLNEYQPQFACPNASNDLFTTTSSSKGNKALTYPIGLITADEIAYAGDVWGQDKSTSYLYEEAYLLTMSPLELNRISYNEDSSFESMVFVFGSSFGGWVTNYELGIRPVVNLKSTIQISQGNGTSGNPYVIKMD